MREQEWETLLLDHVGARVINADTAESSSDWNAVVLLDPDHPGFRDANYRARRNRIARIATEYRPGTPIPDAHYTVEEHGAWRPILEALAPAHRRHACAP